MKKMDVYKRSIRTGLSLAAGMFLSMTVCFSQDASKRNKIEKAFVDFINDSIKVQVNLRYNGQGLPDHYECHINTPVCEHGLCRLMVLDVYWDVLGNFLKYELPPNESLTKFDHMEFTREDHEKLCAILSNKASVLRDYPIGDLLDTNRKRKSQVVDAVSSATRVEVKDAIVGGAVYSTYTLWHIVNGPIASRVAEYTNGLFNEALLLQMFQSDNFYYQFFALDHVPDDEAGTYLPFIVNLVNNGVSYIPYFAIEKIPASAWGIDKYQVALLKQFGADDFELQNALLGKIATVDVCTTALDHVISAFSKITDRQLVRALEVIRNNRKRLSDEARSKLSEFCGHPDKQVSALVQSLLKCGLIVDGQ